MHEKRKMWLFNFDMISPVDYFLIIHLLLRQLGEQSVPAVLVGMDFEVCRTSSLFVFLLQ